MTWPTFALQIAGFLLLAATMHATPRPFRLLPDRPRWWPMRTGGWLALTASLVIAVSWERWDYALLAWAGLLTLSATLVSALLSLKRLSLKRQRQVASTGKPAVPRLRLTRAPGKAKSWCRDRTRRPPPRA